MLISLLPYRLAILRLESDADIPGWTFQSRFFSITRTPDETSIILPQEEIPAQESAGIPIERDWRIFMVHGPLPFSMIGVLEALAVPLAQAHVSIFSLSTYDTDYILVKDADLEKARLALLGAGHTIL